PSSPRTAVLPRGDVPPRAPLARHGSAGARFPAPSTFCPALAGNPLFFFREDAPDHAPRSRLCTSVRADPPLPGSSSAAGTLLTKLGGQVTINAKASASEVSHDPGQKTARFRARLAQDTDLLADAVLLAVPHDKAASLIPPGALPPGTVQAWSGLGASPIVN